MFINISEKHEKHEIGSGTKLLFTFLSLRFFDMRRERHTHNFFLSWLFHRIPPRAAPPTANYRSGLGELRKSSFFVQAQISTNSFARASRRPKLVSTRWGPKITLPRLSPKLNLLLFFKSPKSSMLPGMTSFKSPIPFSIWGFYCDAREHLHSTENSPTAVWVCFPHRQTSVTVKG